MTYESFSPQRITGFSDVDKADDGALWYVEYLKRVNEVPGIKTYKQKVLELVAPQQGEDILDAGCGIGEDLRNIYFRVPTVRSLVGIDNSQTIINEALYLTPQELVASGIFTYKQEDIHSLPFENDRFDACYSDRTFQHLTRPNEAFKEMIRITKPEGRIIVADTDWSALQLRGLSLEAVDKIKRLYLAIIRNPHMGGTLQELFTENGLIDINAFKASIDLPALQTIKDVLALESSLERGRINGVLSIEDATQILEEVDKLKTLAHGSLTIYIVRGLK